MAQISLILIMGLPGAGKTTFSQHLNNYLNAKMEYKLIKPIHVCYDKIITIEDQINYSKQSDKQWKKARINVTELVESLVEGITNKKRTKGTDYFLSGISTECSIEAKKYCNDKSCIDTILNDNSLLEVSASSNINHLSLGNPCFKDTKYLIILDDNFYYRSMRYEYFQLARKYNIGFLQIMVQCPIEIALSQNQQRLQHLPREIIFNMSIRFEPPVKSNSWENHTIFIQSNGEIGQIQESSSDEPNYVPLTSSAEDHVPYCSLNDKEPIFIPSPDDSPFQFRLILDQGLSTSLKLSETMAIGHISCTKCHVVNNDLKAILDFIMDSLNNPVEPIPLQDEMEILASRVKCSQSVTHQADIILRKLVSSSVMASKNTSSCSAKESYRHANTVRQNILQSLTEGSIKIPESIASVVNKETKNELVDFISKEFHILSL